MLKKVDMRSDTVTQPTDRMRAAMAQAVVGDDVFSEDPTINQLQAEAAAIMGKEAALFVASGTMGNLLAVLSHTKPGDEVILDQESHIYYYEVGGIARVAGVMPRLVPGIRGHLTGELIKSALRHKDIHFPETSLVCLENTHNRAGGTVLPMAQLAEIRATADNLGLKIHMDGARIFNAATALAIAPELIASQVDSVMFCLSKGLSAPVGSMLVGTAEFIARARKMRKLLGGGMRQAGVLAAAGLIALENPAARLSQDHLLAKRIAQGLAKIPGLIIDPKDVETNIIVFHLPTGMGSADDFLQQLAAQGILANAFGLQTIRLVTHGDLAADDAAVVLAAVGQVVEKIGR